MAKALGERYPGSRRIMGPTQSTTSSSDSIPGFGVRKRGPAFFTPNPTFFVRPDGLTMPATRADADLADQPTEHFNKKHGFLQRRDKNPSIANINLPQRRGEPSRRSGTNRAPRQYMNVISPACNANTVRERGQETITHPVRPRRGLYLHACSRFHWIFDLQFPRWKAKVPPHRFQGCPP